MMNAVRFEAGLHNFMRQRQKGMAEIADCQSRARKSSGGNGNCNEKRMVTVMVMLMPIGRQADKDEPGARYEPQRASQPARRACDAV